MIWFYLLGAVRLHHMVELTEEEFQIIHEALETVNDPFSNASVEDVILIERRAWEVVKKVSIAHSHYHEHKYISDRISRDLSLSKFPPL